MKLYSITAKYINYPLKFDNRVYDNKENKSNENFISCLKDKVNLSKIQIITGIIKSI